MADRAIAMVLTPRRLVFGSVLVFALLLRLWDLDARSLWFDEAVEYWGAVVALERVGESVQLVYQPPLYSYLLHFWLFLGDSALWMRMPSVLLSVLAVLGTMLWVECLAGIRGASIAGILFAMLPPAIRYAQEVGEYALMLCAVAWALYALECARRSPGWRWWGFWGFCAVMACYSHYGAIIPIGATAAWTFGGNLVRREVRNAGYSAITGGLVALACLPLVIGLLPQQITRQQGELSQRVWAMPLQELQFLWNGWRDTLLFQAVGWPFVPVPVGLADGLAALYAILIVAALLSRQLYNSAMGWLLASLVCYIVLVRFNLYGRGLYGFRYALVLMPLFVGVLASMAIGLGEKGLRFQVHRELAAFCVVAVLMLACYGLPNRSMFDTAHATAYWPETQDMREVALFWAQDQQPGDVTYVYYGATPAFRYYPRQLGREPHDPLPPDWMMQCWGGRNIPFCREDGRVYGIWFGGMPPEEKVRLFSTALPQDPARLWMVFSQIESGDEQLLREGLPGYRVTRSYRRSQSSVYLLERIGSSSGLREDHPETFAHQRHIGCRGASNRGEGAREEAQMPCAPGRE